MIVGPHIHKLPYFRTSDGWLGRVGDIRALGIWGRVFKAPALCLSGGCGVAALRVGL